MKKIGVSLFVAGLVSAAVAQTNAPAVRALSLQDCLAEALKHNFDVRVERYEPEKSLFNLHAAYAGYDPTLSISGTHHHNDQGGLLTVGGTQITNVINGITNIVTSPGGIPVTDYNSFDTKLGGTLPSGATYGLDGNVTKYDVNGDSSSGSVGINLDQPLLKNFWIDETRLNISAAKNQLKYSEQGLRQQLITTVSAVENAFYELIYAHENVEVQQEALNLAQTQLDEDNQRVQIKVIAERGGTIEQDQAQVAQSRANLIAAQFTLVSDENTLKNLITDNYLQWHDVDLTPAATLEAVRQLFDVQDSWSKGLAARPDLLQAKLTLEQQGIQLKYDRNQLFPQLDLTGSYGYNGAGQGFGDAFDQYGTANRPFYSYGGQLSVPLSNVGPRNTLKSDKAVEQQYLLKLKQLEQNVMVEIDNAVKQAQSAWESVGATKQQRIYAEAALDAEQKKYAVGKSTTFTVLQLQNNLTAARSQEIRALANYNEALSNLAQQEGSTLERRNLDVTVK
jgi:outer membrane protein TolC